MTNTNSYDCSYDEKPWLEGIMDILNGRLEKKDTGSEY